MPFTEKADATYNTFNKSNEHVRPGYYSVELNRGKIKAVLTTTARAGFHRYTFAKGQTSRIQLDLAPPQQT